VLGRNYLKTLPEAVLDNWAAQLVAQTGNIKPRVGRPNIFQNLKLISPVLGVAHLGLTP
jgi:hypothetical protein